MIKYVDYDPNVHGTDNLYEIKSEEVEGGVATVYEKVTTEEGFEQAKATPWFFVVEVEE